MTATARGLRSSEPQSVTFVELFFDLVFVFAVTQVTVLLAGDLSASGLVRSLVIFWLIWWAWTQFTWTLSPADTTHAAVRLVTLAATAAAFVMATAVSGAFSADGLWFAVPYVVVRLLGLGLQLRVELERPGIDHAAVWAWCARSLVGLALVLAGGLVEGPLRTFLWLAAIVADMVAAGLAARGEQEWDLNPAHVSERHGLFVIIALGESLIVAGTSVLEEPRTFALVLVASAAIALTCLLWWSYFGWLKEAFEEALAAATPARLGVLARDAFSLAHFPLLFGIIVLAVATKDVLHHPEAPPSAGVLLALGSGVALFVGFAGLSYWRLTGRVLVLRPLILAAMGIALVLLADRAPVWPLGVAVGALLLIVLLEALPVVRSHRTPIAHAADHSTSRER